MKLYGHLISILFFGFYRPIQCQNICAYKSYGPVCCSNYHMKNGKCVACPVGSYGVNCSEPCPKGIYGKFCLHKCNCTEDETCDTSYGCVANSTEVSVTLHPLIETELTTRKLQTTEQIRELQDGESKTKFQAGPLFLYLVSGGCASLLCITCFLVIYRNISNERRGITGNNDATFEYEGQDVAPQSGEQNYDEIMAEHEYIEIIDVDPTYLEPCSRKSA